MAKKVYDIVPPKLAKKIEEDVKEYLREERESSPVREKGTRKNRRTGEKHSIWWSILFVGAACLVALGAFLFFKLPKADIVIWPKVETLSFEQTIIVDTSIDLPDIGEGVIPAQYFETSKTMSEDFPASGNGTDEGRASGTVTVYNKYDPLSSVTLKDGTRFLSDSGKLFTADQKMVIPAGKKSGGKITPGSVQVKVTAVEGGDSYNIGSSNFSIPGLKGTAYYYSIYAESNSTMTGGYVGEIKKVTDDDIQQAKESLIKRITEEAIADLKNQIPDDYVLAENGVSSEITDSGTETKPGTVVDKFNYKATIKSSVLAFKKSIIEEFAKKYIISQTPDGKILLDSSFNLSYSASKIDIPGGKMVLDSIFSSGVYQSIDKNSMSLSLVGKNAIQINKSVSSALGDQLSKVEVNFWPFWVFRAPNNQKAVNVTLKFE